MPAGRADYYGSLPNLAARVSALAAPGQILVEGSAGFQEEVRWVAEESMALMPLSREFSRIANNEEEDFIELLPLGFFMLKVRQQGSVVCAQCVYACLAHK